MPYRLTERGERHREAMRSRMVLAAAALFAQRGYQATTLRDVVQAAGTSIGNLYFYFPNKEALLAEVVEDAGAEIGAALDRAVEGLPPGPEVLAIAVYEGVCRGLANPAGWRLIFEEAAQPRVRAILLAHFVERSRRFFEANPALPGGRPDLVAHAWQGAIFQVLEAAARGELTATPQEVGRFCARWNLRALGLPAAEVEAGMAGLERQIRRKSASAGAQLTKEESR